jgi:hypothetical protein
MSQRRETDHSDTMADSMRSGIDKQGITAIIAELQELEDEDEG